MLKENLKTRIKGSQEKLRIKGDKLMEDEKADSYTQGKINNIEDALTALYNSVDNVSEDILLQKTIEESYNGQIKDLEKRITDLTI